MDSKVLECARASNEVVHDCASARGQSKAAALSCTTAWARQPATFGVVLLVTVAAVASRALGACH